MSTAHQQSGHLRIVTPEGIAFSFPLAGPVSRFLAWGIDFFAIAGLTMLAAIGMTFAALISPDLAGALLVLFYFVISIGYGILLEWCWRGQTLGKKLLRLRVIDLHGLRLQFSQIVLRNLLRFVDLLPAFYLVGGAACLLTRHAQRLGDLAANTVVTRAPQIAEPDLSRITPGKFNSLREYPHLIARLRQQVSPLEAGLLLRALIRRDQFGPEARVELYAEFGSYFRSLVPFPEEAVSGMSDEQYLRNVADVIFQARKGTG